MSIFYQKICFHALRCQDIERLINDYRHAALSAKEAGFDGVEIHAAHGYLLDQFLNNGVNHRTDEYGGSVQNRCRLLFQVAEAVCDVWGSNRVAVRLSPTSPSSTKFYGADTTDHEEIYSHAVSGLNRFNIAYLLLSEPRYGWTHQPRACVDKSLLASPALSPKSDCML